MSEKLSPAMRFGWWVKSSGLFWQWKARPATLSGSIRISMLVTGAKSTPGSKHDKLHYLLCPPSLIYRCLIVSPSVPPVRIGHGTHVSARPHLTHPFYWPTGTTMFQFTAALVKHNKAILMWCILSTPPLMTNCFSLCESLEGADASSVQLAWCCRSLPSPLRKLRCSPPLKRLSNMSINNFTEPQPPSGTESSVHEPLDFEPLNLLASRGNAPVVDCDSRGRTGRCAAAVNTRNQDDSTTLNDSRTHTSAPRQYSCGNNIPR
ncbi:hypothetical protein BJ322DRAFT_1017932 [Thelephora terrestris]|uniref:Uncharacterized protein n=1 Tax=Thelephora terrestris TaxID=56493 RepID=A0A9P6L9Y7_9AGAM|nr:hypothetical protein BJ322DRAFT_1017932 [Thelephora terrestris]